MTNSLPLPLPEDVDVSDMPHMPLFDQRLMKSRAWLSAKNWRGEGPGLAFALLNLWTAAFRTVPAGSLEDDDEVLADQAGVSMEHWLPMKAKALRGWERHGNRVWHPVICELSWGLWMKRLQGRHHKALDSWRKVAKTANDKGIEPTDPPGAFEDWLAAKLPATFAYRRAMAENMGVALSGLPEENPKLPAEFPPKGRKEKDIPPIIPHDRPPDASKEWQWTPDKPERRRWFAEELARLQNEFRPMLNIMLSNLQRPGVSGTFGLVESFKGCWIQRNARGQPEIVARSRQRAESIMRQHGDWLAQCWPDLIIRHAKVEELRERPAA
jgi:hypothetical protein